MSSANNNSSTPSPLAKDRHSDMELMKEKFAKLLLGEDMSGGGKGVSSVLALSNAITNLAASAFGEQKRLETMSETKAKWRKEIDWLISITDYIVEFVALKQKAKDGSTMEVQDFSDLFELVLHWVSSSVRCLSHEWLDLLLVAAILMEFAAQSSRGINKDIPEHSEELSPIKN